MLQGVGELFDWIRRNLKAALVFVPLAIVAGLIIYFVVVVINVIAPKFTEDYLARRQDFKVALDTYAEMDERLKKLLLRYGADRAGLYRFHDDKSDNLRIAYYFCNIDTMVGKAVDLSSITDLNAAVYAPIYPIILKGRAWASDVNDMEDGELKDILKKRGDAFIVYVPIFDLDNDLAGLISVAWFNVSSVPTGDARANMLADLVGEGRTLGGYYLSRAPRKEK